MPGTLFRYIFARFVKNVASVYFLVLGLIVLVDFVEHLRRASDKDDVGLWPLVQMVLLHGPSLAEQVLPFAVLIGSMATFLSLSRTLELVVARASGVSAWQFVAPGVFFALALGLFATTIYSPLAASMRADYDRLRVEVFGGSSSFMDTRRSGSWLRQQGEDGQTVIHAESSTDLGVTLAAVTAYVYDEADTFVERIEAARGVLRPGRWELADAKVYRPNGDVESFGTYVISSRLSPEQVREIFGSTESVSFWALNDMIAASEAAGLSALKFKMQYQRLIAQPITFAAMVLVAATVSLGIFRFGNLARMILTGVAAGFVLYVFGQIAQDLGFSGVASPVTAAWVPALIAMILSVTVLLHKEDG